MCQQQRRGIKKIAETVINNKKGCLKLTRRMDLLMNLFLKFKICTNPLILKLKDKRNRIQLQSIKMACGLEKHL